MTTLFLLLVLTSGFAGSAYLCSCKTSAEVAGYHMCRSCYDGCFIGREGQVYMCIRCHAKCVTCINYGNCNKCHPGRFGYSCQLSCSEGCLNTTCEQMTGNCTCREHFVGKTCEECTPGRYGKNCTLHCDANCWNISCDRVTGECLCNDGFTGLNCSQCIVGRYGPSCQLVCNNGCKDGTCDRKTGQCACKPDFVGKKCDRRASGTSNCTSCESDQFCLECKPGCYGSKCQLSCPTGCLLGRCSKTFGYCQNRACKPGYTGARCNYCITNGKYGEGCSLDCMKNCLKCSSGSICTKCKKGFWGLRCTNKYMSQNM